MNSSIGWWTAFEMFPSRLPQRRYEATKRVIDVALVVVFAPLWVPLTALTALAVWASSPGDPVLFKQLRTGKGGRRFMLLKFRTMVRDAERVKSRLAVSNELKWPDFKITDDPRITPLGKVLRRTSLDELPQLLNVLAGDMSLVGPRPTSFGLDTYELWHTERLEVKPGMTGLWQVIGRGRMEFDDRVRLDVAYVRRRSLRLDALILLLTVVAVLRRDGAK